MTLSPAGASTSDRFAEDNNRAEEFIGAGDLKSAARILVDIVGKDPGNYRAYNAMGIISWMQKAWQDAYAMFLKSASLNPGYADAMVNLFDAALKLRRMKEVLQLFEQGCRANPAAEEIAVMAQSIREQGDEIYQSERGLIVGTYNPRIEEAEKLLDEGQFNKAMEKYLQVNDEEGPNADAYGGLGVISYYQGRYQDAFMLFIESIKINPLDRDMYHNLIDAAQQCGRTGDAKAVFQTYLREFPVLASLESDFLSLPG